MPKTLLAFTDAPPKAIGHPLVDRYLQDMPRLDINRPRDAPAKAAAITEQLARTPEGRRAFQPFYILVYGLRASEFPVDITRIYETGVIDVSRDVAVMAELGARLAARGVELDLVYCDNEDGLSPWNVGIERLKAVYRSPAALERMPERLRLFDVEKIKFPSPEYHDWLLHLGPYIEAIRVEALRKAIYDSGVADPASNRTAACNFHVIRTSFRVYDYNGWEIENRALIDGRTSCPVAYPGGSGQRHRGREHHAVWNSLIDCLNHARSAGAVSDIVPVVREALRRKDQPAGTVDPGGRWLLDQLIGHLVRTGASRFMMFHAHASAADDLAMAETLQRHEEAAPATNPTLPEVPLDVDEVVTGDWRTTYSDFLRQSPDGWVAQK